MGRYIELDNEQKTLNDIAKDVQNVFFSETGTRLDSADSLFLARELTGKSASVLMKEFEDVEYNKLPQHEEPETLGNRTVSLPIMEGTGGYTVSDDVQEDTKEVGAKRDEQIVKVKVIQNHVKFNSDEIQRAIKHKIPLSQIKLNESRKHWEYANDDACFNGLVNEKGQIESEGLFLYFKDKGKFNMTEFTGISNSGSGSGKDKYTFKNKTVALQIEEMLNFLNYTYEKSKTMKYKVDTAWIPLGLSTIWKTQGWTSGASMNIWDYLQEQTKVKFIESGKFNKIDKLSDATQYQSAIVAYKAEPTYIAHITAEAYNLANPFVNSWFTRIEAKGKVVGGVVREPQAVVYCQGIYNGG